MEPRPSSGFEELLISGSCCRGRCHRLSFFRLRLQLFSFPDSLRQAGANMRHENREWRWRKQFEHDGRKSFDSSLTQVSCKDNALTDVGQRFEAMETISTTNVCPTRDEIATCAYFIYLNEGRPTDREEEHWSQAEAQLIGDRIHNVVLALSAPIRAGRPHRRLQVD